MASGTLSSPSRLVCVRNSPRVLPTLAAGRAPVALALSPEASSAPPAARRTSRQASAREPTSTAAEPRHS
eukprot:scaffold3542_cov113-Isochrysis_galbana.AAC.8